MTLELNKIHNVDCLEFMRTLPDKCIDLVLTDPPYEISSSKPGNSKLMSLGKYNSDNYIELTKGFDVDLIFGEFLRVLKSFNCFVFCSNDQLSKIMSWGESKGFYTTCLVWNKTNSAPFANNVWRQDIEFVVHIREKGAYFEGNSELKKKVIQLPTNHSTYGHPTEKPIEIIYKYLQIGSKEGDIIFDPFIGSGTTGVACQMLNRNYIGCEISPEYCKIAEDRIKAISNTLF